MACPKKDYSQNKKLWDEFLSRKKCLACGKRCETDVYRPLCLKCFKKEKNDGLEIENNKISIDENLKNNLRRQLKWLDEIEGNSHQHAQCKFCKGKTDGANNDTYSDYYDDGSNYVKQYTWWYGDNKRICTVCLDEECKKRGIDINKKVDFPSNKKVNVASKSIPFGGSVFDDDE